MEEETKEELIEEIALLRKRIAAFEMVDAERKKTEKALRESEETLRAHIENSFDVIFTLNQDGAFSFISPAWERHFGFPLSDAMGKPFMFFVHPDDIAPLKKYLERVLSSGKSEASPDYRVKHADGSWRWFIANGTSFVNTKGERQFIGIGHDVTERRKYEERIFRLNEQLQTILDASPTMIFYKDKENRFIRVNKAFAEISRMSKKEMEGKSMWDLYPKEAADHYWQDDKEVFASGIAKLNIVEELKTSQGVLYVQTDKILYRDSTGDIKGIIGFSQDITERKRTEKALQEKMKELEGFNKIAVGRELRMIELKEKLRVLEEGKR